MVFQSFTYLWFLLCVLTGYFALQWPSNRGASWARSAQNLWLLAASYTFYGWVTPWWLILIATTTVVEWTPEVAVKLMQTRGRPPRPDAWNPIAAVVTE